VSHRSGEPVSLAGMAVAVDDHGLFRSAVVVGGHRHGGGGVPIERAGVQTRARRPLLFLLAIGGGVRALVRRRAASARHRERQPRASGALGVLQHNRRRVSLGGGSAGSEPEGGA